MNPASPNNLLNIVIGVLLGAMIGIGLVFIRELMDKSVKTEAVTQEITGWHNLGQVREFRKKTLKIRTALPKKTIVKNEAQENLKRTRRKV